MVAPPFNAGRIKGVAPAIVDSFIKKNNPFQILADFPLPFTGQNSAGGAFSSFSLCREVGKENEIDESMLVNIWCLPEKQTQLSSSC